MAKITYTKIRGTEKIRRNSRQAVPVADTKYRNLHEVIYREIRKRECSYAAAAVRAAKVSAGNIVC